MYLRNVFIFLALVKLSYTQRLSNQERLYKHLFEHSMNMDDGDMGSTDDDYYEDYNDEKYDSRTRPVINFNNFVNTTFSLKIYSLDFFKQPEEKIKFNVELDLYWNDEFLRWRPRNFGNVTRINVNPNQIWIPDIELYNSGAYPQIWTKDIEATLDYMGNIYLPIPLLLTFSCKLELEEFPFDKQMCSMEFGSWKFSQRYLDVRVINETLVGKKIIQYDNFYHNEWNIINANGITEDLEYLCCPGEIFPTSTLTIELERKFTKYNIVIIMTVFLTLSSLNVLLLSMEKYRRTFILVFIPLTIIWVQLYIASKIPVIEYPTRMENLLMSCYYTCMVCASYSGIIFCFLNNELSILKKLGVKVNVEKTYYWKPDKIKLTFKSVNNETVAKKYLDLRQKVKVADNVIKITLFFSFFISVIVFLT